MVPMLPAGICIQPIDSSENKHDSRTLSIAADAATIQTQSQRWDAAQAWFSEVAAGAGEQFGTSDVAALFSRESISCPRATLLSWSRHGCCRAGDCVVQTVRTLFALGRRASHRAWHHFLATPGRQSKQPERVSVIRDPPPRECDGQLSSIKRTANPVLIVMFNGPRGHVFVFDRVPGSRAFRGVKLQSLACVSRMPSADVGSVSPNRVR
jgi:hypothetical protein